MSTTKSDSPKPQPRKGDSCVEDLLEHVTTISHILLLCVTIFVMYLCFQESKFSLLVWHVLLYILGWAFISTEGIMFIAKENILGKHLASKWRNHAHWVTLFIGVGLTIGGFATIVYSRKNRKHFTGEHGMSGLISLIFALIACCNGIPALFAAKLRKIVSPNLIKIFHSLIGIVAVASGLWATITGYYLRWFTSRATSIQVELCVGITIACTVWACLKPLLNIFVRSKNSVKSCVN